MIKVENNTEFIGDLEEKYYLTNYKENICSLGIKYKEIYVNACIYNLIGLLWENAGKENEITYYLYKS